MGGPTSRGPIRSAVMPTAPTHDEVRRWFDTLSNWGRWGPDDTLGTLNHITPEKRVAATREIREGITVSCARDFETAVRPEHGQFGAPHRHMLGVGESVGPEALGMSGAYEYLGFVTHGYHLTHLDGLSHIFFNGRMYNDRDPRAVTAREGATQLGITDVSDGIVTRGVLLDVARARGVDWLGAGDGVYPEDLEATEAAQGVRVEPGDAVLLRTGYGRARRLDRTTAPPIDGHAGWHAAALPWIHERGVALISCDTAQEAVPSGYAPEFIQPVHAVGIVAMGLWLLDNADFEELAATAERLGRWSFHLSVGPLRLRGATGAPVNPIATF